MKSVKDVNVIGHISAGNFGDEMMLHGLLRDDRLHGKNVVVHRSQDTDWLEPGRRAMGVVFVKRYSFTAIRALASGPTILCGGTTFHDANAGTGALRQALAIYLILARLTISKIFGFENHALAIGVGPVHRRLTKFALLVLARIAEITVRDEPSRGALEGLGILVPIEPDLAFSVEAVERPLSGDAKILLVAPCSLQQGGSLSAGRVAEIFETQGMNEVRILAFNRDGKYADVGVARSLQSELDSLGVNASLVDEVDSIYGVLAEFASASLVIAGRFHALVAALVQDTEVIAACYHEKMVNLAVQFGIAEVSSIEPSCAVPSTLLSEGVDLRSSSDSPAR